jgi:alpha-L-rhamnosidase
MSLIQNAKWIWHKTQKLNQYVDFIKTFTVREVDKHAVIQISVDSEYVLYINGSFVNCGQYGDFPFNKIYDEIDISPYLKEGENRVYIGAYYQGETSLTYYKGDPGLIFAIKNGGDTIISDRGTLCAENPSYQSGDFCKTTWQLGYAFLYNAMEEGGAVFENAAELYIQKPLSPRPVKKNLIEPKVPVRLTAQGTLLRQTNGETAADAAAKDYLSHKWFEDIFEGEKPLPFAVKSKEITDDGVYFIIDLGKESCGFLTLDIEAGAGVRLDISFGEHLDDLRVRSKIEYRNFTNTYICKEGRQSFTYYYRRIAGRYLGVHVTNLSYLTVNYIGLLPVYYPLNAGLFRCSDSLHNKIFDVCVETLRLCMHEHYEDCPWREQALYASDSRNQILCGYYVFGEFPFARASLDLLGQGIREDNYLSLCAPSDFYMAIPSFTMLWFAEMLEYAEASGDLSLAEQYRDQIIKMIRFYCSFKKNGLLTPASKHEGIWNFYEWSEDYAEFEAEYKEKEHGTDFIDGLYNLFAYYGISCAVKLLKLTEGENHTEEVTSTLAEVKKGFNSLFWDKGRKLYASHLYQGKAVRFDELTQAMAVYSGICGKSRAAALAKTLMDGDNGLVKISLSYALYKYDAIIRTDRENAGYVFDDIAEKWGKMLFLGATSFWETEGGASAFGKAGSLCHGWSATPVYFYLKYAAGAEVTGGKVKIDKNKALNVFPSYRAVFKAGGKEILAEKQSKA